MILRRSLLYVPGNMPGMLQNIPVFEADGVMIDLEDAVPLAEKDSARLLTRNFLASYKERTKEMFVRINGLDTPYAADDLREVLPALPTGIRLPKADHPDTVERLDTLLTEQEEKLGLDIGHFKIIPSIESARGVLNCVETAKASKRLAALACGEDTDSMGPSVLAADAAQLPRATIDVLAGLGHFGPLEQPGVVGHSVIAAMSTSHETPSP